MREYELVLMLDPGQDAPARDAVAKEARGQIEAAGTLKHENEWGLRKLAYEIAQRNEADYRWFRFEGPSELLEQLDHNLKITDGVLRFRIFKVGPETPMMVPPATAAPGPAASRERPAAPAVAEAEAAQPASAESSAAEEAVTPVAEAVPEVPAEAPAETVAEAPGEPSPAPAAPAEGEQRAEAAE
jgi:small subunit ribosomal protein S6